MAFDITRLKGTGELFDQIKSKLDNLSIVLDYYAPVISDVGVNNYYELGDLLISDTQQILDVIDVMTKKLENIRTNVLPFPPCYTSGTGPVGWTLCTGFTAP